MFFSPDRPRNPGLKKTPGGVPSVIILWVALLLWPGIIRPHSSAAQEVSWDRLADGLTVSVWVPGTGCQGNIPPLVLVKVDPERFGFMTYHFRDEGLQSPLTMQEWQRRTHADLLFNGGLFLEDFSYIGLLFKEGRSIGSKAHPQWKGLFVAEPFTPGLRRARVVDLARESIILTPPAYRQVAQSLMLFDTTGLPRVRKSGKRAQQTVVGEDQVGNIVLIKTAQSVALWELAICLRDGIPGLRHAMVMDGGSSSDLMITKDLFPKRTPGRPLPPWQTLVDGSGTAHIPLPAVIGIKPRRELSSATR